MMAGLSVFEVPEPIWGTFSTRGSQLLTALAHNNITIEFSSELRGTLCRIVL